MDDTAHDYPPGDYHHGEMPIPEQHSTYALFGRLTKWAALHIAVLVTIFTLWFCTGAGFVGGLIPGAILWVAGIFFLRSKPDSGH